MRTKIFYFTGTGNSLMVAKKLAVKLGNTEVVSIVKTINDNSLILADRIGIVFPVYAFNMPHIVKRFILKLNKIKYKNYIFVVITYGGEPGNTFKKIKRSLSNCNLNAMFAIRLPQNYIPFLDIESKEVQEELFNNAEEKINEIVHIVSNEKRHFDSSPTGFYRTYINPGLIYNLAYPMIPKMDKDFWVNDNCDDCGICLKVCPVNNIKMNNEKPEWQHNCEQCLACMHWCPKEAIQWGKNTASRGRYQNPEVTIKEMFVQKE